MNLWGKEIFNPKIVKMMYGQSSVSLCLLVAEGNTDVLLMKTEMCKCL